MTGIQSSRLGRWLSEPLLHFVLLGAGLFLLWGAFGDRLAAAPNRIVVSAGEMQRGIDIFQKTHLRPPDTDELKDLVEQQIEAEVYFREGVALGLDRDDEIIRRRMKQKLQFMIEDVVGQVPPTDAELQTYLDQHRENYGAEAEIAFSQVYLNPERRGDTITKDAQRLLARLNVTSDGRIDYAADGDILPVSNDFETTPLHVIAGMFGEDFAASLASQPVGQWVGPIRSGYGLHLVLVRQRKPAKAPILSEVRDAVARDWENAKRAEANRQAYLRMRDKYKITVEMPPNSTGETVAAGEAEAPK